MGTCIINKHFPAKVVCGDMRQGYRMAFFKALGAI